jgi:hypothetical protein
MLIKWENFGAFLFGLLRWENVLTGDAFNEFYCNCCPRGLMMCVKGEIHTDEEPEDTKERQVMEVLGNLNR